MVCRNRYGRGIRTTYQKFLFLETYLAVGQLFLATANLVCLREVILMCFRDPFFGSERPIPSVQIPKVALQQNKSLTFRRVFIWASTMSCRTISANHCIY